MPAGLAIRRRSSLRQRPSNSRQLKQLDDELAAANDAFARLQPDLVKAQQEWEKSLDRTNAGWPGDRLVGSSPTIRSTAT